MSSPVKERKAVNRKGGVTRTEYDRLLERLEDLEDLVRVRAAEERTKARDYLPAELVKRMIAGESAVRLWREHRGLTLNATAEKAGIPASYLSEIENGKKPGSVAAHAALARALLVRVDDLI